MNDTTAVALGKLMMPLQNIQPQDAAPASWGETALNGWILVAAVLFIILNIKNFYSLFPTLWSGVFFQKFNVMLEDSVERVNTRNLLSVPFIFALCLVIDRFVMPQSDILSVFAFFAGYWLYKFILTKRIRLSRVDLNFAIVITTVLLLIWPVLNFCAADFESGRTTVLATAGVFFLFQLIREFQFLRPKYSAFRTILYLCALELLPIGILILIWPQ